MNDQKIDPETIIKEEEGSDTKAKPWGAPKHQGVVSQERYLYQLTQKQPRKCGSSPRQNK